MVNRIELPKMPEGNAEEQMRALYSYLYQMAQALNNNLAEIGGAELTDSERVAMQDVLSAGAEAQAGAATEAETLKSLIIKTASFIKTAIDQYNLKLTGSTEAEGKIGKYVRNTQMDVDVTPEGIQQSFSFQEIIQGLKTYEINAKNYIKSGLLRTVNGIPVYGIAVGKDIVTFAEDGTETYNDGNKVAEFTADSLSFWQNGTKVAQYTGNRISFFYGSTETMYIQNGKLYVNGDMEIVTGGTLTIRSGSNAAWEYSQKGMKFASTDPIPFEIRRYADKDALAAGLFTQYSAGNGKIVLIAQGSNGAHQSQSGYWDGEIVSEIADEADYTDGTGYVVSGLRTIFYANNQKGSLGKRNKEWNSIFTREILGINYNGASNVYGQMLLTPNSLNENIRKSLVIQLIKESSKEYIRVFGTPQLNNGVEFIGIFKGNLTGNVIQDGGDINFFPRGASGKRIIMQEYTYNGVTYTKIYGTGKMVFEGDLTGNVKGNVEGNVTGNVTGDVTGTLIGNVVNNGGAIFLRPRGNNGKYIVCQEYTYDGVTYTKIYGTGKMVFEGDVTGDVNGKVLMKTTSETDYNNITEPGSYFINLGTMTGHKPTSIVAGVFLLNVYGNGTTHVQQNMQASQYLLCRTKYNGTWGPWYKFVGTYE